MTATRRTYASLMAGAFLATCFAGAAGANTGETPPALDGARTVTAAEAKGLLDKGAVVVLDVRRKAAFLDGHLPRARGIAKNAETKAFDIAVFGPNKDATIMVYGHGTDGWSAVDAIKTAVAAGFRNVAWLRGGWSEWSAAGLPVEQ